MAVAALEKIGREATNIGTRAKAMGLLQAYGSAAAGNREPGSGPRKEPPNRGRHQVSAVGTSLRRVIRYRRWNRLRSIDLPIS